MTYDVIDLPPRVTDPRDVVHELGMTLEQAWNETFPTECPTLGEAVEARQSRSEPLVISFTGPAYDSAQIAIK